MKKMCNSCKDYLLLSAFARRSSVCKECKKQKNAPVVRPSNTYSFFTPYKAPALNILHYL